MAGTNAGSGKKKRKKAAPKKKVAAKSSRARTKRKSGKTPSSGSRKRTPMKKKAGAVKQGSAKKPEAKKTEVKKPEAKKAAVKKPAVKKPAVKKPEPKKTAKPAASKAAKEPKKSKAAAKGGAAGKAPARGGKPKIAVNLPPKGYARPVAPGVRIEAPALTARAARPSDVPPAQKLGAKDARRIREILLDKRESVMSEIRHQIGDSLERTSVMRTDTADRASDVYDGDVSYEMALAGSKELEQIDEALRKLDQGTYGACEGCGVAISPVRLKVLPFAVLCSHCSQEQEAAGSDNADSIWGFLDAEAEDNAEQ